MSKISNQSQNNGQNNFNNDTSRIYDKEYEDTRIVLEKKVI